MPHFNIQKLKNEFIWHISSMSPNTIHNTLWWRGDTPWPISNKQNRRNIPDIKVLFLGHKTWLHIADNTDPVFTKLRRMHHLITFKRPMAKTNALKLKKHDVLAVHSFPKSTSYHRPTMGLTIVYEQIRR